MKTTNKIKIGIIGNGKMAIDCMRHILSCRIASLDFVIFDPELETIFSSIEVFAKKNALNYLATKKINAYESLDFIKKHSPDYIFNINSYRIINNNLRLIPQKGIINFHNAPLPLYGGVNIPTWAILNNEKKHGVTWHFIDEGIDTGDILVQKFFEISENTTAAQLMTTCIKKGIELFYEHFENMITEQIIHRKQQGKRSYYSLKDLPPNNGIIDFSKKYNDIQNLVNALNYIPFENNFCYCCLTFKDKTLIINEISNIQKTTKLPYGKVIKAENNQLHIACQDAILSINSAMRYNLEELTINEMIKFLTIKKDDFIF